MAVCCFEMLKVLRVIGPKQCNALRQCNYNFSKRLFCAPACHDDRDPGPLFINAEVQALLKKLTRIEVSKVFKKRKDEQKLAPPEYRFLTEQQLKQVMKEANEKIDQKLQMPPVVKTCNEEDIVLSHDSELKGYCDAKILFTDISYGVSNKDRLVVVRDQDGTLHKASKEQHSRMNQLYFPMPGRQMQTPRMFQHQYLQPLLEQQEYEFVLDRTCIQMEPDDPEYQRITAITYDHVDEHRKYDLLRSTRHFGPLAFHLAWHRRIDNLLLDTIQTARLDESTALIQLFHILNPDAKSKVHGLNDVELIKMYIEADAVKKASLELALQTYLELEEQRLSIKQSIQRAHGT